MTIVNLAAFRAEGYWIERALALRHHGDPKLARKAERLADYWYRRLGKRPTPPTRTVRIYADLPREPIRFTEAE